MLAVHARQFPAHHQPPAPPAGRLELFDDGELGNVDVVLWMERMMDGDGVHRFSSAAYHRMADVGVLSEDTRVELINGLIIDMAPVGSAHIATVARLTRVLVPLVAGFGTVSPQSPVRLADGVEPEPDIAVLRHRSDDYEDDLPRPDDILLLIEVADTSLAYDRDEKAGIYAAAGIPEYWIANLLTRVFEVHRRPVAGKYDAVFATKMDDVLEPMRLPGVQIHVSTVLRPRAA